MANKIKLILIIALVGFYFNANAQLNRANRYYQLYRFSKAIPLYKKVINNTDIDKKEQAIVKLANCYRKINNAQEAQSWYYRVIENSSVDPINYYYLASSLCQLENYEEAKMYFEKYLELSPNDSRAEKYISFCDWALENKDAFANNIEIKNEKGLNTKWSDFSPVLYNDGIVFASDRLISIKKTNLKYNWTNNAYLDLYYSKPKYYKDFWSGMSSPVALDNNFNSKFHDGPASFSKDGSRVVISRTEKAYVKKEANKIKTFKIKLFYADIVDGQKTKYTGFPQNSDSYSVAHPQLSSDGKTMIFSSDMPGGKGQSDLYITKFVNDEWTIAENISSLNTEGNEVFPYLVNDTILLFASDGHPGFGGLDIFLSIRDEEGNWSEPINLMKPINSSYDDFGALVFSDLKAGFFSSNRPGGQGLDDIYSFRSIEPILHKAKTEKVIDSSFLAGYVKDKNTLEPIPNATVFLHDMNKRIVKILKTDNNGFYKTFLDTTKTLQVKAMQVNYISDCQFWKINSIEPGAVLNAPRDLLLDKLELNKVFVLDNIYYDYDKYFIRDDAKPELNKIIKIMIENPYIVAELSSHTDSRGAFAYNNVLSQNRANAAVEYIVSNSEITSNRLVAKGYGEYKLVNKCSDGVRCTEEEHQLNRRTEFKVTGFNQPVSHDTFDPSKFVDGEEFDIKLLPDFFFDNCNESK